MKFSTCTIASFGATIRKYATALTRTGTLSFVITSCGGMLSVIVRRSTLTIRSTTGISRKSPGPFGSGKSRPSRKTMPRSYSRATLIAEIRKRTTRKRTTTRTTRPTAMTRTIAPSARARPPTRPGRALPARGRRPSVRRARHSSPSTKTWPGRADDGLGADDAQGTDADRASTHLHRFRERERPEARRARPSTRSRAADDVW